MYVHLYRMFTPRLVQTPIYPNSTVTQIRYIIKTLQGGVHGRWGTADYQIILWTNVLQDDIKKQVESELNNRGEMTVSVRHINTLGRYKQFKQQLTLYESRGMTEFVTDISTILVQQEYGGLSVGRYTNVISHFSEPKKARYPRSIVNIFSIARHFSFLSFLESKCCAPHKTPLQMFSDTINCYKSNCGDQISLSLIFSLRDHPILIKTIEIIKFKLSSSSQPVPCWNARRELISNSLREAYDIENSINDLLLPSQFGTEIHENKEIEIEIEIEKDSDDSILIPVLGTLSLMSTPPLCGSTIVDLNQIRKRPFNLLIDPHQSVYFEATFNRFVDTFFFFLPCLDVETTIGVRRKR